MTLTGAPAGYSLKADNGFFYILVGSPGGQDLYWHPLTPAGPGNFGGSGTWTAAGTTTWADSTGTPLKSWTSSDIAVFTSRPARSPSTA